MTRANREQKRIEEWRKRQRRQQEAECAERLAEKVIERCKNCFHQQCYQRGIINADGEIRWCRMYGFATSIELNRCKHFIEADEGKMVEYLTNKSW